MIRAIVFDLDDTFYTREFGVEKEKPCLLPSTLILESPLTDPDSVPFLRDNSDKDCRSPKRRYEMRANSAQRQRLRANVGNRKGRALIYNKYFIPIATNLAEIERK